MLDIASNFCLNHVRHKTTERYMSKKAKTFNLLSKNNIIAALATLSFIGTALLWVYFISFTQYVNVQNDRDAEQLYKLGFKSAQQQYCIENTVKPCTQDAINAHAESATTK
jgi:hypothetical protein